MEKVAKIFKKDSSYQLGYRGMWLDRFTPKCVGRFCEGILFQGSHTANPWRAASLWPTRRSFTHRQIPGVTDKNLGWVWALVVVHNFNYCTGWQKPVCVPFSDSISSNQKNAITEIARSVDANIMSGDKLGTLGEAKKLLTSKKYDYAGRPVEYMEDLIFEKVKPAWPKKGIMKYLSDETRKQMESPQDMLLPMDMMPEKSPRSRVRASDQEWFKLCAYAHSLGMMKVVEDVVPRDRSGHLITNGAGAVKKEKIINGKVCECQRFISILVPTNAATMPIKGAQDTLPYIGTLSALMLEDDEVLYLDSEDLQSAFNLFSVPDQWLGFFSYSKKVDGKAFGLPAGKMVRPALAVVPMGWHSAVGIVQETVRNLVFQRAKVNVATSVEKGQPIPDEKSLAVVYLDNFDEITILKRVADEVDRDREMTENHRRFIEVCDTEGLPRNLGKQLIRAMSRPIQEENLKVTVEFWRSEMTNSRVLSRCHWGS